MSNNGKKPAYRPEVKEMAAILFLCKFEGKGLKITPGKQVFWNQHPQIALNHFLTEH